MNKALIQIRNNFHTFILMVLNLVLAFFTTDNVFIAMNNPIAVIVFGYHNIPLIFELITAGFLFLSFLLIFFPKQRIGPIVLSSLTIITQLVLITILSFNIYYYLYTPSLPFIYTLAAVTLIERIFDISFYITSRRKVTVDSLQLELGKNNEA